MEVGIITAALVITIYILIVILLWRAGILEKLKISAAGPLLMWRTTRGVKALDRAARRKNGWRWYGNVSLGLMFLFMGILTLILAWEFPLALKVPVSSAPGPEMIIGLPGINPLIPIGYGIFALAIAILIHEFAHGILTRAADVEVKSMGLLLFVVPIGAFVEPNDEELNRLPRRKRMRMYAVGPASNLILAFVCAGIFCWGFMGAVTPVEDGVIVTHVIKNYPSEKAGLKTWCLITAISFDNLSLDPGITGEEKFQQIMAQSSSGDNITITFLYRGSKYTGHTVLADKYDYYARYYNESNKDEYRGKGFLGIGTMPADTLSNTLSRPMRFDSVEKFVASAAYFVGLPFFRLLPLEPPVTDLYSISGPLGGIGPGAFWMLANTFYWLFWLNLMVGATNCLPIPKFDGGMVYKDSLDALFVRARPGWTSVKREKVVFRIYVVTGLTMIFLIMWQFIGPRIGALIK